MFVGSTTESYRAETSVPPKAGTSSYFQAHLTFRRSVAEHRSSCNCNVDFCTSVLVSSGVYLSAFLKIITLHTFDTIWRRGGIESPKLAAVIVGTIWTFLVLTVSISTAVHRSHRFYAPTPVRDVTNTTGIHVLTANSTGAGSTAPIRNIE
jgi:hypothetical protein